MIRDASRIHGGIQVKSKYKAAFGLCTVALLGFGTLAVRPSLWGQGPGQVRNLSDEALLSLIKNDKKSFIEIIQAGVNLQVDLPAIEGKTLTLSEGLAHFSRPDFIRYLQHNKISFIQQLPQKDYDILTLAISKNNPELLELLIQEKPQLDRAYGKQGWSLLHLASSQCSHKLTELLHKQANLSWNLRARDGSTPLTLAAESDCLPMLSFWKSQSADFHQKDGRGLSALAILRKKQDAALVAFADSFVVRSMASSNPAKTPAPVAEVNFYRKRKIPRDQLANPNLMIEPDIRPLEATETAEFSEFAD